MSNLYIRREHALGLVAARAIAFAWAERVETEYGMECVYEEGDTEDRVIFSRSGVHGVLHVTGDHFELDAKLGLLLGAFKGRIEAEIVQNLDDLLVQKPRTKPRTKPKAASKSEPKPDIPAEGKPETKPGTVKKPRAKKQ